MPEWFKQFSQVYESELTVNKDDLQKFTEIIEAMVEEEIDYKLYLRLCDNKFSKSFQDEPWFYPAIHFALGWYKAKMRFK